MKELLRLDIDWVPESKNASVYIRPTMIGTEVRCNRNITYLLVLFLMAILSIQPVLGVKSSGSALLFIVLAPVGAYFTTGALNPIALWADTKCIRAWPGGLGWAKVGGYVK